LLGIVSAGIAFVVIFLYANLFEYTFHRWLMHGLRRYVSQPYETHVHLHHRIFRGDHRYHVLRADDRSFILFEWWQAPLILGPHAAVLWGMQATAGWPVLWPGLAALGVYYLLYEYLHWCMHNPTSRRIERTSIFRYLDAHHRLHHAHWRINFNVVLPLADLVFRTFRATSLRAGARMLRREPVTTGTDRPLLRATSPARAHFAAAMMSTRRAFMTRS
jgi:hypothetical protein